MRLYTSEIKKKHIHYDAVRFIAFQIFLLSSRSSVVVRNILSQKKARAANSETKENTEEKEDSLVSRAVSK